MAKNKDLNRLDLLLSDRFGLRFPETVDLETVVVLCA